MTKLKWSFIPFNRSLKRDLFDCGKIELNNYLKKQASQDIRRNVSRIFLAVSNQNPSLILGFYTLSANSIHFQELPPHLKKKVPRYPVPVAIIGRLAVDKRYQGLGIGKDLLVDGLKKVAEISKSFGIFGIMVEAKDKKAKAFYEHFGFLSLKDLPNKLILSLETIKSEFED